MGLFVKVEGAAVILSKDGIQRQADVFVRDDRLFARYGAGFIGLSEAGAGGNNPIRGTTVPRITWLYIEGVEYHTSAIGWMLRGKKGKR